ncbi:MAG: N-acetylmuramoyl-L-alanine amidase, partial [Oscillospiraceae bacterium]
MTRDEDVSTESKKTKTGKSKKKSDMYNRLDILNGYKNNVFISIHQNKFSEKSSNGAQIFYSGNNNLSESLAKTIKNSFRQNLQPENHREEVKAKKNLFLLYNAKVPAVLVECGFMSNDDELKKLKDGDYQTKVALSIFDGLVKFLGEHSNKVI